MSNVTPETIRQIAQLARLHVPDEAIEQSCAECRQILDWMATLSTVDTSQTQPMRSPMDREYDSAETLFSALRDDACVQDGDSSAILANAPEHDAAFFVVPKVVD